MTQESTQTHFEGTEWVGNIDKRSNVQRITRLFYIVEDRRPGHSYELQTTLARQPGQTPRIYKQLRVGRGVTKS